MAIHKICKKHGIPNPPWGYWAKKANGKPVAQTPLPPPEKGMADAIVIADGNNLSEPDSLRSARERARINASSAMEERPAAPHPVVERTITALDKAKPDEKGLVRSARAGRANVAVSHASIERLRLALDRLFAAAAVQGFQVGKFENGGLFDHRHFPTLVEIGDRHRSQIFLRHRVYRDDPDSLEEIGIVAAIFPEAAAASEPISAPINTMSPSG